jgi:hypothetical protein
MIDACPILVNRGSNAACRKDRRDGRADPREESAPPIATLEKSFRVPSLVERSLRFAVN